MKYTFILLFLIFTVNSYCKDNIVMIGNKSYNCTSEKFFGNVPNHLKYFFARDNDKALIFLKTFGGSRVAGNLTIYLSNNTTITLIDRKQYDFYNDEYISVFRFTSNEVKLIKEYNIIAIRIPRFEYSDGSVGGTKVIRKSEYQETTKQIKLLFP